MRDLDQLMALLSGVPAAEIAPGEAALLVEKGRVLREADTRLAGPIRVVEIGGVVVVVERTTRGQPVARVVASPAAAGALIEDRLAVYERMWDGCGCKVDYLGNAGGC